MLYLTISRDSEVEMMKKSELNRFLPFEADYSLLTKCRKWGTKCLVVIGICSVILPVLNVFSGISIVKKSYNIFNLCYFLLIIGYYILSTYTETFLYPATARKRRKGFIDNSLGSKFLNQNVNGYYTNDYLTYGPYKMIVNCCENCYFTLNIAKKMVRSILMKNILFGLGFLIVAYWGIRDNLFAIPMVQILLSSLFMTELVHHINFITKLEQLYERFIETICTIKNMDEKQILQEAVLLFLDYETTLAYNKAPLSDAIYEELNEKLSKEWEDIKVRYDISKRNI